MLFRGTNEKKYAILHVQAMEAYRGRRDVAPVIHKLNTRWRSEIVCRSRGIYSRARALGKVKILF
jgi:hypothetical protein